jgi:hypothetical protein
MQLTNDFSIKLSIKFRLFPGHGGATLQSRTRSEVAEMSSLALSKRFFRMEVGRSQPWRQLLDFSSFLPSFSL